MGKRNKQIRNNSQFYSSLFDTMATNSQYTDRLTEIALSSVKWNNLPETIDARFLEWCLFYDGMAVFFKDDVLGYLCLQTMPQGQFNVYRVPTQNNAYAVNGYQEHLDITNSVIIYNNLIRKPSVQDIKFYASRLTNVDLTIQVNVNAQKTPVAILCNESQKLTFENLYQQYAGNMPFIFGDKSLDLSSITALNTRADFKGDVLYKMKTDLWNEALTYLGVSNVSYQKKERVNTDEVQRSMGGVFASRRGRLKARQQACEQINKMFGLDISVEYEEDVDNLIDDSYNENGGEDDE